MAAYEKTLADLKQQAKARGNCQSQLQMGDPAGSDGTAKSQKVSVLFVCLGNICW